MQFTLDPNLPRELAPLAWLIGLWEGAGVVGYPTIESANFGQELEVTHDGRPFEDGEVELLLTHPTGIVELYYGKAEPAKIELRTDGVLRSPHAKEYNAGSRLYGLVNSNLMWAMDMAAVGQPLQSHLSAELKRVG
jgi:hypothetical protein